MATASSFRGFSRQMISFFRGLEKNNDRDWFVPRKDVFESQCRAPMLQLVELINQDLRSFAAQHVADQPARAIYRIYRDTRFAKDKTPYKTHIGAIFPRRGTPKHGGAGLYFSVSHKEVEVAGGVYMPGPDEIRAIRTALARDGKAFLKLIADRTLAKWMGKLQGETLARMPKGFEDCADSEAAHLIRMKNWYWYVLLPASLALTPKIRPEVVRRFERMMPALDWLNEAMLAARKPEADEAPCRPEPMW